MYIPEKKRVNYQLLLSIGVYDGLHMARLNNCVFDLHCLPVNRTSAMDTASHARRFEFYQTRRKSNVSISSFHHYQSFEKGKSFI